MTKEEKQAMLDVMKKDKDGQAGERKFWSPPSKEEGSFKIRFLPPLKKKGEVNFYFSHKVHWIDGVPYECLNQSLEDKNGNFHDSEPCPICNFCRKLYKTAVRGDDDWKLAGEINAKQRRVSRIIVRGKDDETIPEFYEYGATIFNMLHHIMTETDFGVIVDPKEGRDFVLTKVGTGRRSRYETSTPAAKETSVFATVDKIKKVFTNAMELDYKSIIEFTCLDGLKAVLNEYLGIETKKETTVVKEKTVEKVAKKPTEETTNEDKEIDDILSEFTE